MLHLLYFHVNDPGKVLEDCQVPFRDLPENSCSIAVYFSMLSFGAPFLGALCGAVSGVQEVTPRT